MKGVRLCAWRVARGGWHAVCFGWGWGHGGYCFFRICDANRNWFFCAVVSAAISAWLTASHPNSEVKQVRAGVVLRWGTTREGPVLRFLFLCSIFFFLRSLSSFLLLCSSCFFFSRLPPVPSVCRKGDPRQGPVLSPPPLTPLFPFFFIFFSFHFLFFSFLFFPCVRPLTQAGVVPKEARFEPPGAV